MEVGIMTNNLKDWSIKLGFNGEITDEFVKKYKSVMKVRKKIKQDLFYSSLISILYIMLIIYIKYFSSDIPYETSIIIIMTMFFGICIFAILGYTRVIYQWRKHDKEMIKEWEEKKMNTLETLLDGSKKV
jgi:uncharacterized membrane protein